MKSLIGQLLGLQLFRVDSLILHTWSHKSEKFTLIISLFYLYGNALTVPVITDGMYIHTKFCCTVTAVPNVPLNSRNSKMIS